jgi:hypothetical protein
MYEDDRAILTTALEEAAKAYRALIPVPTILGAEPGEIVDAVSAAVDQCKTYQAIAGLAVFSGGSGPVLDAHSLASKLFSEGVRWGNDIPAAVEWLIRLMTTRETLGLFKAGIWGLGLNQEVSLTETSRLMPFDALADSSIRRRLVERAKRPYALYDLRNQATHGGTLKPRSTEKSVDEILRDSFELYVVLMKKLLGLRAKPDWKALELGPG